MRYPGHSGRRKGGRDNPYSGLTGDADRPSSPAPGPTGWRERLRGARDAVGGTFAGLPRVLGLVRHASLPLTLALLAATVLMGLQPAIQAVTAKLLINAVVHAIQVHAALHSGAPVSDTANLSLNFAFIHLAPPRGTSSVGAIVILAALQFVIYAVTAFLSTIRNIAQQLLQERVQLRIQLMVMDHASKLDLQF
ncbi:MAG TPA: ABC transporter ATP-binding protein, partial [Chloroflexota bacterium]|nr:ABC transporter ATP-binding protein [Chloroflexota bacterium]